MKNQIAQIIKQRRKMLNINQEDLAQIAQINKNTLTKLEKGENVSLDTLLKILDTLGLEIQVQTKK